MTEVERSESLPAVTIVVPCLNEEQYIEGCLDSIIAGTYPLPLLQILILDGMSGDQTRSSVARYATMYPNISLVDNPGANKSEALNIGIAMAEGELLMRLDAHCRYAPDYIAQCVESLAESSADNVGGYRSTLPGASGLWSEAIAVSISHPFAAGNAVYRVGRPNRSWVDTVFGGCYPIETLRRLGGFDRRLIRGQDRELNWRLTNQGGKILYDPRIKCQYYARGDLRRFIPWIYEGGFTPFYISRITGARVFGWRNLVPVGCLLVASALLLLGLVMPVAAAMLVALGAIYLFSSLSMSIAVAVRHHSLGLVVLMLTVFAITHVVYALGSVAGLVSPKGKPRRGRA